MARPVKATVTYFPLDCEFSDSLKIIENLFGNDGFVLWVKLLQKLGRSEYHYIDLRNTAKWKLFYTEIRLNEDLCLQILNELSELDCINKSLWKEKIIYSENFIKRIEDAYKRRREKLLSINELCQLLGISVSNNDTSVNNNPPEDDNKPQRESEIKGEIKGNKRDIYYDPEILKILEIYQEIMGSPAALNSEERNKLSLLIDELSGQRFIPADAMKKVFISLKSIKWDFRDGQKKPKINWLLKDNNFFKVLNGEFSNELEEKDDKYGGKLSEQRVIV